MKQRLRVLLLILFISIIIFSSLKKEREMMHVMNNVMDERLILGENGKYMYDHVLNEYKDDKHDIDGINVYMKDTNDRIFFLNSSKILFLSVLIIFFLIYLLQNKKNMKGLYDDVKSSSNYTVTQMFK